MKEKFQPAEQEELLEELEEDELEVLPAQLRDGAESRLGDISLELQPCKEELQRIEVELRSLMRKCKAPLAYVEQEEKVGGGLGGEESDLQEQQEKKVDWAKYSPALASRANEEDVEHMVRGREGRLYCVADAGEGAELVEVQGGARGGARGGVRARLPATADYSNTVTVAGRGVLETLGLSQEELQPSIDRVAGAGLQLLGEQVLCLGRAGRRISTRVIFTNQATQTNIHCYNYRGNRSKVCTAAALAHRRCYSRAVQVESELRLSWYSAVLLALL